MRVQYVLRMIVKSQDFSRVPGSNLPSDGDCLGQSFLDQIVGVRGIMTQRSRESAQRWNEVDDGLFGIALRVGRWQI